MTEKPETDNFMYWLGVHKGKAREQERIIELITESQEVIFDDSDEEWDIDSIPRLFEDVQAFGIDVNGFRNRLIAFIKGEK